MGSNPTADIFRSSSRHLGSFVAAFHRAKPRRAERGETTRKSATDLPKTCWARGDVVSSTAWRAAARGALPLVGLGTKGDEAPPRGLSNPRPRD